MLKTLDPSGQSAEPRGDQPLETGREPAPQQARGEARRSDPVNPIP